MTMAQLAASACGAGPDQALVMSTGIIGVFLPMDKITAGIRAAAARLGSDEASFLLAARGITTTDKSHKIASRMLELGGRTIRLAGMCKGAGMIGPRMATMLAVVLTDAALTVADAQASLVAAVEDSFNCISVEGHMSTNDTLLLLASGAACAQPLAGADLARFQETLREVCIELAKQIPDDGEGATHLVTIDVQGTATRDDAFRIAKTVAESALVKTAIAGGDPNWGRIVSAAGYAGVPFDPARVSLEGERNPAVPRRHARPVRRRHGLAVDASQPRDPRAADLGRRHRERPLLDQRPDRGLRQIQRRLQHVKVAAIRGQTYRIQFSRRKRLSKWQVFPPRKLNSVRLTPARDRIATR